MSSLSAVNNGGGLSSTLIDQAAQALARGDLVAFPTETVYGLGARADDDAAVAKIFAAKGRPADHPLIVHVVDAAAAHPFASEMPEVAVRLMAAFWPGPVTIIVPRRAGIAQASAGGQDSIGLRCPAHPMARALLEAASALGVKGVAAPSANRFGRVSPTTASHVRDEFGPGLLVLDGGACEVGIESAIVDCTRGWPVLLRPGVLTRQELEQAAGQPLRDSDGQSPRASGTLESHYAPGCRVRVLEGRTIEAALAHSALPVVALYSHRRPSGLAAGEGAPQPVVVWRPMAEDPRAVAQDLFAALRDLDAQVQGKVGVVDGGQGGGEIWVQAPPADAAWDGVRDRLRRAAA